MEPKILISFDVNVSDFGDALEDYAREIFNTLEMAQIYLPDEQKSIEGEAINLLRVDYYDEPKFLDPTRASRKKAEIKNIVDAAMHILSRDWHIAEIQEKDDEKILILSN